MKTDSEEERELWRAWASDPISTTRNRLIEFYLPQIEAVARKLWFTFPVAVKSDIEIDDLVTAAVLDIESAIETFDPSRNIKPTTYLMAKARWRMLDYLRRLDWVPRLSRSRGAVKQKYSIDRHWKQSAADAQSVWGEGVKVEHDALASIDAAFAGLERSEFLDWLLRRLSDTQRTAVRLYYFEHLNMREAGERMGLSESRVSQLVAQALQFIRETYRPD